MANFKQVYTVIHSTHKTHTLFCTEKPPVVTFTLSYLCSFYIVRSGSSNKNHVCVFIHYARCTDVKDGVANHRHEKFLANKLSKMQIKACQFRLYCQDIINSFTSCVYFCTYIILAMVCGDSTHLRMVEYKLDTQQLAIPPSSTYVHLILLAKVVCVGRL